MSVISKVISKADALETFADLYDTDSEGDYYCDMNYVLAWMPLTEPYKERREE